jgi:hypothetical protein
LWQFGIIVTYGPTGSFDYSTSGNYSPGWHHYAGTYSDNGTPGTFGANGCLEYIDGTIDPAAFQPGSPFGGFQDYDIGAKIEVSTGSANGPLIVAYPAVWKGIVLTQAQITALAKGCDPRKIASSKLASFSRLTSQDMSNATDLCKQTKFAITGSAFTFAANPPLYFGQ